MNRKLKNKQNELFVVAVKSLNVLKCTVNALPINYFVEINANVLTAQIHK